MKKYTLSLIALFIVMIEICRSQNPNPALDSYITGQMSTNNIPGVSACIVKKGEIVWKNSYGKADIQKNKPVTENTIFFLASVSKTFTATAFMQLYEQGLVSLDQDINDFLPFQVKVPGYPNDPITFRMLLTHTSSIQDNGALNYDVDGKDWPTPLSTTALNYFSTTGTDYSATGNFHANKPGTKYDYSNMAITLLGYLVERISGIAFNNYCKQHILKPLCMYNSSFLMADFDTNTFARAYQYSGGYVPYNHYTYADYPAGTMRTSIKQLANYLIMYTQRGKYRTKTLLKSSTISLMNTLQVPTLDSTQGIAWYKYNVNGHQCWGHNGGDPGVTTDIFYYPQDSIGVAVLSNGEGYMLDNIFTAVFNYALTLSPSGAGNPICDSLLSITENPKEEIEVMLFPNPGTDHFEIEIKNAKDPLSITVSNVFGEEVANYVFNHSQNNSTHFINTSNFAAGIYFVQIKQNSSLKTVKFIKADVVRK